RLPRCRETPYCTSNGRRAWKAYRKAHEKICWRHKNNIDPPSPPKGLEAPITKPFTRLDNGTWLHDRPEADVYRVLIDAHRLRMDDDYNACYTTVFRFGPRSTVENGAAGFADFLAMIEQQAPSLLPAWWDATNTAACIAFGSEATEADGWSSLTRALHWKDVIGHYGEMCFDLELRVFAQAVYGIPSNFRDLAKGWKVMVALE
ncbi:hypothetical protein CONLIGDRAFT_565275, partial [Coniochaeta ligniaria NRRL 30616]